MFLENNRVSNLDARIKVCCGSLIEIRTSVVQLLHLTAREYLLHPEKLANPFDIDEQRADTEISSCCLRYLCLLASQPQIEDATSWDTQYYDELARFLSKFPLINYALEFLLRHLKTAIESSAVSQELSSFLQLAQRHEIFHSLFADWSKRLPTPGDMHIEPKLDCCHVKVRCLLAAAKQGLVAVVETMVHLGADLNAVDREIGMTALQVSALEGHVFVIDTLLAFGADVNAMGGDYGSALQAASFHGNLKVVEILLNNGAISDAQGGRYGNALQAASSNGYVEVVKILIEAGANPDALGGQYVNALQAASINGHNEVVRMLLEHGANPNAQGGQYGNALQAASSNGYGEVVKMLLDAFADPNLQGGQYGNALQAALMNGHEKVARILQDRGADSNAQCGQ
ncbi:unnamed protein product [Penicillium salamii]|nr:unnamed protein product [Penicillium salamii]